MWEFENLKMGVGGNGVNCHSIVIRGHWVLKRCFCSHKAQPLKPKPSITYQ